VVSNSAGHMAVCLFVSVVCCQVEVPAMVRSLVLRSPTDRGVSDCVPETSTVRRPMSIRADESQKKCLIGLFTVIKIYYELSEVYMTYAMLWELGCSLVRFFVLIIFSIYCISLTKCFRNFPCFHLQNVGHSFDNLLRK